MKIDDEAIDKILDWLRSANAAPGDRELIGEFIRSLGDESWNTRWYSGVQDPDLIDDDIHRVVLRRGLSVTFRAWPDGTGEWFADIIAFTPVPPEFEDPWALE